MLTTDTLHELTAHAAHGHSSPCLIARETYQALLRECLASRQADEARTAVVAAARHLANCPLQDGMRALEALCVVVAEMDAAEKAND